MSQAIKIFSKSLTKTDTRKRLAIPAKILPALPDFNGSHAVKILLMYGTREWPIVCSVRKLGYKKPVFSGGWSYFVNCNNLNVGDELTLYKVHDEEGTSHYRIEVEKPARSSGNLSPRALSLNHDVDETTGTSRTQVRNFEHQQELLKAADAPIKEEGGAIMEIADFAADVPVPCVDHVISKPSCWIFGTNLSDEATSKAHLKTEQKTEIKFFGCTKGFCMGEPPFHSYYTAKEEREIKFFGLAEGGAMTYGTSQAAEEACCKSSIERLSLDLFQGQATPYAGEVNLDLTLAPPIVDGGQELEAPVFAHSKP
ncbi:hypothetical protein CRYUN_Cryun06bG0010100 [Craigia yunnanensis]